MSKQPETPPGMIALLPQPNDYKAVRFAHDIGPFLMKEDVHEGVERVLVRGDDQAFSFWVDLRALCEWLGIPWERVWPDTRRRESFGAALHLRDTSKLPPHLIVETDEPPMTFCHPIPAKYLYGDAAGRD